MLQFLKNHPFEVEAYFKKSMVLTFAVPKEQLQNLIPECLELDIFNNEFAFIAIALVETKNLRPKGFPKFMGNDFFLIGYRIFVRYKTKAGKNLRGLYILKSETDKKKMEWLGNIFTHYNYTSTDINHKIEKGIIKVDSKQSKFNLEMDASKEEVALPESSPFLNWKEARRFAGPLPFTFTYLKDKQEVLIIEGLRSNWVPRPVKVVNYDFEFLNNLHFKKVVLANAFIIEDVPYSWKKGKIEKWNK